MFVFNFFSLNEEPSFQYKSVENKKELIIVKKQRKPCLRLMIRCNSLKYMQHFHAHNSN